MRFAVALLLVVVVAVSMVAAKSDREEFEEFKSKYPKFYASQEEEEYRFKVFCSNLRRIEALNKDEVEGEQSAHFAVNKFSDLEPEEFKKTHLNLDVAARKSWTNGLAAAAASKPAAVAAPAFVDWRSADYNPLKIKAVSRVKDQGQCGSCWAFSAAASLESCQMIANADSEDVNCSPQQLVDCCTEGGSDGCNGGDEDSCLNWLVGRNAYTWDSYPYTARDGKCNKNVSTMKVCVKADACKFEAVEQNNETAMQVALQTSPLSVAIAADILQSYSSGVISGKKCVGLEVDHAVQLVGMIQKAGVKAYVVKNSWAGDWGEEGYFRLALGVDCLQISSDPSHALPSN